MALGGPHLVCVISIGKACVWSRANRNYQRYCSANENPCHGASIANLENHYHWSVDPYVTAVTGDAVAAPILFRLALTPPRLSTSTDDVRVGVVFFILADQGR